MCAASGAFHGNSEQKSIMSNPLSKELVRAWLKRRLENREPPPELDQIRREVGWDDTGKKMEKELDKGKQELVLRPGESDALFA